MEWVFNAYCCCCAANRTTSLKYIVCKATKGCIAIYSLWGHSDPCILFLVLSYMDFPEIWLTESFCCPHTDGKQVTNKEEIRNIRWCTWTSVLGSEVNGIWEKYTDTNDVNATDAYFGGDVIVTGDDFGMVKLFRFPSLKKGGLFTLGFVPLSHFALYRKCFADWLSCMQVLSSASMWGTQPMSPTAVSLLTSTRWLPLVVEIMPSSSGGSYLRE